MRLLDNAQRSGDAGLHARARVDQRGLPVYVLLCQQLIRPAGQSYGDDSGRDWPDNDIRFGRFASAAAELAAGTWTRIGQRTSCTPTLAGRAHTRYLAWRGARIPSI